MKASDLFVKCLEEEGVELVFGVPGEENLDVVESLRTSAIRLVVTRHEQHAAFMAATYGRLTGRAGVCLSTLGPGATNLVTGLAYAQLGGMPLVAITGQKSLHDNWQGNFQLIDVVSTFRPLTKWNTSILSGSSIPRSVRNAFKMAESERPGAVHLELAEDVASQDVADSRIQARSALRRPVPDDKAVRLAAERIRAAKHPMLIASAGANRKRIGKQLHRFLEKTGIYGVTTQMGKGVISDDSPYSLFTLGIHKKDYVQVALDQADLVLAVGYDIVEYPPSVWNAERDKAILHIDFNLAETGDHYSPELEVVGDISYSLWALYSQLEGYTFENDHLADLRQRLDQALHPESWETSFPPRPQQVVLDVRKVMGPQDIICLDNGIYKLWFARMYKTYDENTVLLDNALATMGAGLASAMAAKMVEPERRCLAICGDGGFLMNSQDLETSVRLGLDLVILILRDDAYGFIRWKQESMGFADYAMGFGNPDFVKYAEAYGARGLRVGEEDNLIEVLDDAFARGGTVIVECPIDYSENSRLHQELTLDL